MNLLQFSIKNPVFNLNKDESSLKAEFTLHRNPSYMIINAYIPSFSIMVMTIVPLYLREEIHFATTIMLVLTSLLCLYTLFQSSLAGIPKTAYLKHIDYWNILALTVTLMNFFTLVFWEIFEYKSYVDSWKQLKRIMRWAIPLVTLLTVSIYWITAAKIVFDE